MNVVEAWLRRGGTGLSSRGSHAYHVVQLAVYVCGMLRYAPEIRQLYFGGYLCPKMEVIWVFFAPGIDSLNEAVRGINEGPLLFPEDGRELYGTGRIP
jgi:hypothetical protein